MALPTITTIGYYVMSIDDRRKHKRYEVQGGTFAAVPSNYLVGQVKNISRGGLAFNCIASCEQDFTMPVLDIF